ncbi:MAG: response regulator, partial [Candidatus Aminicenantes bacterium]|nr:response regulator [Candidatus Aminicenantes bacterium]
VNFNERYRDLNKLVEDQVRLFARTRKEIVIHEMYEEKTCIAEIDQNQVEQVLLNIFVNAWQAMSGGGDIYVQTGKVTVVANEAGPYEVNPGEYIKISITDTGVGMDESTKHRIFDPFFTTKEMGRGTGLGLASAYGITRNHGGFIKVHSKKGEGATFSIFLPASKTETIEENELAVQLISGDETILFVDDEYMVIEVGEQMLEEMGYTVLLAEGGEEAVDIFRENKDRIDMVILDMIMPGMGGGEVFDRLKEFDPCIKVLLSSGYSINSEAAGIMERGCAGFIQKPFDLNVMSRKIREILDK